MSVVRTRSVLGLTALVLFGPAGAVIAQSGPSVGSAAVAEIPVEATFTYSSANKDDAAEVRGAVHGVRRIPGGTAVYYSLGVAPGESVDVVGTMPAVGLAEPYAGGDAFGVRVIDPKGLLLYQPLYGAQGCLCSEVYDFSRDSGRLSLGWAVLPELPADVQTVSVLIGFGSAEDVPVEQGPLTPEVPTTPLLLGQGWPVLPTAADVTQVGDQEPFVRRLVRRTADRKQTVTTSETSGTVDEALSADVLFAVGSATLSPAARGTLQEVAVRLKARAAGPVAVVGHTDTTGSGPANQALSEARATAVRDALQGAVGAGVRFTASGAGETQPIADETTPDGRQANRRVTVTYVVKTGS